MVQTFLPAVKHGDKRIILVDGEYAGAVNRVPAPDDLRSNMVRGGSPKDTELTPREREICRRLGPALRERGLIFVGIDVIDGHLTEINVTSPTGIRAIRNVGGPDVAKIVWDAIEKKRKASAKRLCSPACSGKMPRAKLPGNSLPSRDIVVDMRTLADPRLSAEDRGQLAADGAGCSTFRSREGSTAALCDHDCHDDPRLADSRWIRLSDREPVADARVRQPDAERCAPQRENAASPSVRRWC